MSIGDSVVMVGNGTYIMGDVYWNTTVCQRCIIDNRTKSGEALYEPPDQSHIKYITLVFYLITFVFGLVGNTLVLYVIARFSKVRKRSVANYYIWNLALADELYIFALPGFCFTTYTRNWIFGDIMCKMAFAIRECNKFASVFTLVALSIDRYLATYHNLARVRTIKAGKIVCLAIWVICLISCTPYFMYSYTVVRRDRTSCEVNWPSANYREMRRTWTYTQFAVGYVLPLLVIITSSGCLLWRVRSMVRPGAGPGNKQQSRNNSNITKTFLVVVGVFMVCQLPYHVMEMVSLRVLDRTIDLKKLPTRTEVIIFVNFNMMSQILVFVSSCCNPIVYGIFNKNFRNLYKQVLSCGYFTHKNTDQNLDVSNVERSPKYMCLKCCKPSARRHRRPVQSGDASSSCKQGVGLMEIEMTTLKKPFPVCNSIHKG